MQLTPGTSIAGYEVIKRIGKGGMGDVYQARQESLNRIVALKVLPPELSRNKEFTERFDSEARVISLLEHHNIVSIYDFGEESGLRFFAMQYVEGESLDQRIDRDKRIKLEEAVEICRQILRALKYAHEHKVIHRDIKPHNVLIDRSGKVFVSDFGIAKIFANTRITNTGMTVGTPEYMSPEQSEGGVMDARTDIYSLGIVLYEMLVGRPPFMGESPLAVAYKQVNEQPRPPYEFNGDIPVRVGMVVLRALKKDKTQRYQSAAEMLDDLDAVVAKTTEKKSKTIQIPAEKENEPSHVDLRITDRRMGDRRRGKERISQAGTGAAPPGAHHPLALCVMLLAYLYFTPGRAERPIRSFRASTTSVAGEEGKDRFRLEYLTDGDTATAWAEGAAGAGLDEYVLFTFKKPVVLSRFYLWNGTGGSRWNQYNRAKKILVTLSNERGKIYEMADLPGRQYLPLPMSPTSFLRISLVEVYPGEKDHITAISEVEFWGMKAH